MEHVLNSSKNANFTIWPSPRFNALLALCDFMNGISRKYLSGADKAVQIRRSVFVDKGTQPKL